MSRLLLKQFEYTFENFITGPDNLTAFIAAKELADCHDKKVTPLILYGGPGNGKTHLANAVVNHMLQYNPELKYIKISSDIFMNDFITALGKGRLDSFKKRYQKLDLLVMEHIQFLLGKEETPSALGSLINHLIENNKKVLITSDRHPKSLNLNSLLLYSIKEAHIIKLLKPNIETGRAYIKHKLVLKDMVLTDDMIEYIAKTIKSSIRAIDNYLSLLILAQDVKEEPLTFKDIKIYIKNFRG